MPTFVALLRGINVGKAKRVRMADLRALLEGRGYTGVATLLNSGNAVFRASKGTPAKHAASIATALVSDLGIDVPVVVKASKELATIVEGNPIQVPEAAHSRCLVAFTQDHRTLASLASIQPLVAPPERFAIGRHAAYLLCPGGLLESKAGKALLGKEGRAATTRNWATTLALHDLASGV